MKTFGYLYYMYFVKVCFNSFHETCPFLSWALPSTFTSLKRFRIIVFTSPSTPIFPEVLFERLQSSTYCTFIHKFIHFYSILNCTGIHPSDNWYCKGSWLRTVHVSILFSCVHYVYFQIFRTRSITNY